MRLFAAVWPPADAVSWLESQSLATAPGIRPTSPTQWHVTLAFYGEVPDDDVGALIDSFGAAVASVRQPPQASFGDRTVRLGRSTLAVPVVGLEPLAGAVMTATERWLHEERAFRGHLTLARARGSRHGISRSLVGVELHAARSLGATVSWTAHEACLVRSSPGRSGHEYRTIATATVGLG
jgi:2'-5' RNA ligase